jgi:hypothetical protein
VNTYFSTHTLYIRKIKQNHLNDVWPASVQSSRRPSSTTMCTSTCIQKYLACGGKHHSIYHTHQCQLTYRESPIHTSWGHIFSIKVAYTTWNRVQRPYPSWLPHTQFLKHLTDFHKTRHQRYATKGHFKATIFSFPQSVTKARGTRELARWETQQRATKFEQLTTAHPTAHLPSHGSLGQHLERLSNVRLGLRNTPLCIHLFLTAQLLPIASVWVRLYFYQRYSHKTSIGMHKTWNKVLSFQVRVIYKSLMASKFLPR